MENLEGRIMEVLQDPSQMEQILNIAKNLGISGEPTPNSAAMPEIGSIMELLQKGSQQEPRRDALLHALLPYLRPDRQRRLEKAMQLAKLSNLAGFALQSLNDPSESG